MDRNVSAGKEKRASAESCWLLLELGGPQNVQLRMFLRLVESRYLLNMVEVRDRQEGKRMESPLQLQPKSSKSPAHFDIPRKDKELGLKTSHSESMCATRNHPPQRPLDWLLPPSPSPQHEADRLVALFSFPSRTIFEESVLLKYFPLDASRVSRMWSCQLGLVTAERNTSKCCCDMAFGSGGAWGREGG